MSVIVVTFHETRFFFVCHIHSYSVLFRIQYIIKICPDGTETRNDNPAHTCYSVGFRNLSLPQATMESESLAETLQVLTITFDEIASLLDETFKEDDIEM